MAAGEGDEEVIGEEEEEMEAECAEALAIMSLRPFAVLAARDR